MLQLGTRDWNFCKNTKLNLLIREKRQLLSNFSSCQSTTTVLSYLSFPTKTLNFGSHMSYGITLDFLIRGIVVSTSCSDSRVPLEIFLMDFYVDRVQGPFLLLKTYLIVTWELINFIKQRLITCTVHRSVMFQLSAPSYGRDLRKTPMIYKSSQGAWA